MRVVSYADEHFLTTDGVASAVLEYSKALALASVSDVVRIPVVAGEPTWAELIIGPASQITTLEVDDDHVQLDEEETIRDIRERIAALLRPNSVSEDPEPQPSDYFGDLDLPAR